MPVSSLTIWGPLYASFFAYYVGPPDQFLRILYGAPSDQFLSLLAPPPPRSLSSLTIWGHPQVSFFAYYMRALSQINFFAYYVGNTSDQILPILYGGGGGGGLRSVSSLTIGGPLRSVYSHTIWSPPFRSISSLAICGGPLR